MSAAASRTYTGDGIQPAQTPEEARTDAVVLMPGTYPKGTVVGQMTTLTAVADVQTISTTGTVSGGTFRLSFYGQVTAAIAYNASAAVVQAAVEALSSVGTGNVVGTGGALPGTPVVLTFAASLLNRPMPDISVFSNSTTGTNPVVVATHTTLGRTLGGAWKAYDDTLSDGSNIARAIVRYDTEVDPFGNHRLGLNAGVGEWGQGTKKSAPVWIAGTFKTNELTGIDAAGVTDLGRIIRGAVGSLSNDATLLRIG